MGKTINWEATDRFGRLAEKFVAKKLGGRIVPPGSSEDHKGWDVILPNAVVQVKWARLGGTLPPNSQSSLSKGFKNALREGKKFYFALVTGQPGSFNMDLVEVTRANFNLIIQAVYEAM